jgi:hypothetical protein
MEKIKCKQRYNNIVSSGEKEIEANPSSDGTGIFVFIDSSHFFSELW